MYVCMSCIILRHGKKYIKVIHIDKIYIFSIIIIIICFIYTMAKRGKLSKIRQIFEDRWQPNYSIELSVQVANNT